MPKFLSETSLTKEIIENSRYLFFFLPLLFFPIGLEYFETPKYFFLTFFSIICLLSIKFKDIKIYSLAFISFLFYIFFNFISSIQIFFKESFFGMEFSRYNSILFILVLFVLFIFFSQKKFPKNFINTIETYFLVGVFISVCFGVIQFLIKPLGIISSDWYFDGRIVSTLGHPNFLASATVVALILLERTKLPWVYLVLVLGLVLTFSKTSVVLYFFYSFIKYLIKLYQKNRKIAITLFLVFTLLIISIIFGLFTNTYKEIISNNPSMYQFQRFLVFLSPEEFGLDFRFKMWDEALHAIKDSPYLGYGKGQIIRVVEVPRDDDLSISSTHNLYIDIALESGLLGLTSFLVFMIVSLINSYNFDKHLFMVQLFIVLHGFFDITPVILWFLFIFISAISINKFNKSYLKQL